MTGSVYAHDPKRWRAGRHVLAGAVVIVGLAGGGGYWATTAELEGAVVARGELRVETNSKPVQHREGGTVGAIHVAEGDTVTAGQPLLDLDRTTEAASLAIVDDQLLDILARRARLLAERDEKASITFPDAVLDQAQRDLERGDVVRGQRRLFRSRLAGYNQQRAQFAERIGRLVNEIRATRARRQGFGTQLASLDTDLTMQQGLLDQGLSTRQRVQVTLRERARVEGEIGALEAQEAGLRRQIQETQIELTRLRETRREEALDELRDVETRIAELRQRKIVASDALRRIELRAPVAGVVQDLSVYAVGAVVGPGEPVLTIVPVSDRLILEARVPTDQRDRIALTQPTRVRFTAFNQRTTPELNGEILSISADRKLDETNGAPYYDVQILLSDSERARLGADNRLVPGMPAEIYIRTESRSPLSYMLKPLTDNFARAFKE